MTQAIVSIRVDPLTSRAGRSTTIEKTVISSPLGSTFVETWAPSRPTILTSFTDRIPLVSLSCMALLVSLEGPSFAPVDDSEATLGVAVHDSPPEECPCGEHR